MPRIATLALIVLITACADSPTASLKGQCVGAPLLVDNPLTIGHTASCLRHVYPLPVAVGQGYLVTMTGTSPLLPKLVLTTADTLLAINRGPTQIAHLLFASTSTRTDTVQALPWDSSPSDTGSYSIAVQSCPVRAMVSLASDSATVTDSVTANDCQVPDSAFGIPDANLAQLQLFAVHWDSGFALRRIAFRADEPLRLIIGGWHDDTFGGDTGTFVGYAVRTDTVEMISLGPQAGDYTILLATDSSVTTTAHYTMTIGPETPSLSHGVQFIRHRSWPMYERPRLARTQVPR